MLLVPLLVMSCAKPPNRQWISAIIVVRMHLNSSAGLAWHFPNRSALYRFSHFLVSNMLCREFHSVIAGIFNRLPIASISVVLSIVINILYSVFCDVRLCAILAFIKVTIPHH